MKVMVNFQLYDFLSVYNFYQVATPFIPANGSNFKLHEFAKCLRQGLV